MSSQIKTFPKKKICKKFNIWEKPGGFTDILDKNLIEQFYDEQLSEEWDISGTYKNFIIKYPLYIGTKKTQINSETEFINYLIQIFTKEFTKEQIEQFNLELKEKGNPINMCATLQVKNKDLYTQNCDLEKQLEERDKEIAQLKTEKDHISARWKREVNSLKTSQQEDIERYKQQLNDKSDIILMLKDKLKFMES